MKKLWLSYWNKNVRYLVWSNSSEYSIDWMSKGEKTYTQRRNFTFMIYHYPFRRHNNYILEYTPEYAEFDNDHLVNYDQSDIYQIALQKLQHFQKGKLIEELILQD